jgi:glycosyltransferase involved in cell wall biosynthesis
MHTTDLAGHLSTHAVGRAARSRVRADGKHLALDGRPFRVRGATYGSFRSRRDGALFPEPARVDADFAAMATAGLNTVRVYTAPPPDVLDLAAEHGLRLVVGLHYLDWRYERAAGRAARRRVLDAGRRAVEEALAVCAGRPEVLALSVGNEVPADLVRLHGARSVEWTLSALVAEVHESDPGVLATYTNFPTTEYLHVDGQDLVAFNVFLEQPEAFRAYLRHLQVVAGNLPLVLTELGLASAVHGEEAQADALAWQLRLVEETGCAGATVFSWTDEWAVADEPVESWGFGLTDELRRPRASLGVARVWAEGNVRDLCRDWPRVSVVVCAHDEEVLIGRTLASLAACDYPGLEVIVCDDGSNDRTLEIARTFPFRVLALPHGGLSTARNAGIAAAGGDIVAFLDADAECHPEWPYRLALSLEDPDVDATGGPNLSPESAPLVERAVAASPGAPSHVLTSDDRAEHVPGCNMAFRKEALLEVGGFDPIFTSAGDDVDVCWKLLDRGREIAFAPAAQVRHHRPASTRVYLRQQRSYGRAERVLSGRHRHRFNGLGQARWAGFIYGGLRIAPRLLRPVVYHGTMGFAPFQAVAVRRSEALLQRVTPLLPLLLLPALAGLGAPLAPWLALGPALALAALAAFALVVALAARPARTETRPVAFRALVAWLHLAQPFARTWGRAFARPALPAPGAADGWTGNRGEWLRRLFRELAAQRCTVRCGQPSDAWDLAVSVGPLVSCRITTAVAWSWTPLRRVRLRLRAAAVVAVALTVALAAAAPAVGLVVLAVLVPATLAEAVLVTRLVRRALDATAAGAGG